MRYPGAFLASLLLSASVIAAEPPQDASAAPDEPGSGAEPAPASAPSAPSQNVDADRFKPTEKISEDLSVSFPADI